MWPRKIYYKNSVFQSTIYWIKMADIVSTLNMVPKL